MTGFNARSLTIDWDSTTLAGVQSKDFNINNELVDVTTDDDSGWTTYLSVPGKKSVTGSVSGITSDEVLIAALMDAADASGTLEVNFPSALAVPGGLSGTFMFTDVSITGSSPEGAVEFTASFVSSGVVTYTASAAA